MSVIFDSFGAIFYSFIHS